MKKFKIILLSMLLSVFLIAQTSPSFLNPLITTALDLTTSWADLGSEINLAQTPPGVTWKRINLYVDVDINAGNDIQVRILYLINTGEVRVGTIQTAAAAVITLEDEIFRFPDRDPDSGDVSKFTLNRPIDSAVKFLQIQVLALTVGSPKAQIELASYSLSRH